MLSSQLHRAAAPSPAAASQAAAPRLAAATPPPRRRARCSTLMLSAAAASSSSGPNAAASTAAAAPARDYFTADRRPVVLYDGVCNLCNFWVNFMLEQDKTAEFRLAALQSPAGRALLTRCGRAPDDISSIVLATADGCYIKSEAVRRIGERLGAPFPFLAAVASPVPLPIRDFLYDQVADNRYNLFGRTDVCRLTEPGELAARFISD